ncbi:hypothetical protein GGP41_009271 [Bipolaris sorokiniana]|uniref:Uncharacterized protein n=1 Tax=Cochliobolus sativus TaxID=45130 RepID=A0A8H5ZFZ3_COCSA|nr:hypothetical protein GGP41_009271 [Bipolaris sorokiniana]
MPRRLRAPAMFDVYFPAQSRCWHKPGPGEGGCGEAEEEHCRAGVFHVASSSCGRPQHIMHIDMETSVGRCVHGVYMARRGMVLQKWIPTAGQYQRPLAAWGMDHHGSLSGGRPRAARAVAVAVALSSPPMPLCRTAWPCQAQPDDAVNKSNNTMAAAATSMSAVQCSAIGIIV